MKKERVWVAGHYHTCFKCCECGEFVDRDWKYCANCGYGLEDIV